MSNIHYGTSGPTLIVFPCQDGQATDFENFGLKAAIQDFLDQQQIQIICLDSIDCHSFTSHLDEHQAILNYHHDLHMIFQTIIQTATSPIYTFGASLGAYHALHTALYFPDKIAGCLCLSGVYDAGYYFPHYQDPLIYEHSPLQYLQGMSKEHPYLSKYRKQNMIFCCGQGAYEQEAMHDFYALKTLFQEKNIPAWFDLWGKDVHHDWQWWRKQFPYFLPHLLKP